MDRTRSLLRRLGTEPDGAASPLARIPARGRLRLGWPPWSGWPLRLKLLAAIILCLLPLVLLLVNSLGERYATRKAEELAANRDVAEAVAAGFDAYTRDLGHYLGAVGLALGWRFDLNETAAVQAYLTVNRLAYPSLAVFVLTDPQGRVVAADPPEAIGVDLGNEGYVQVARGSRDAVVSDLLPAPGEAPPWFAVARAIYRPSGDLGGVLVAYVDVTALGEVLSLERLGRAGFAVLDRQGRVVYASERPDMRWAERDGSGLQHVRTALAGQPATNEQFTGVVDRAPRLGAAAPIPGLGWVATADRPLAEALAPIENAARQDAGLAILAVLLAVIFAAILAHALTQPLRALQRAVRGIEMGDYARRVPVRGGDETAELGSRFNAMAERLETLEQERRAFAAMVAHDLRSPLTAVRGTAELLQRRVGDDARVHRWLDTIVRETDRVARLAADLGDAASAAAGRLEIRPARVNLVALVVEAIERLQAGGASQPVRLTHPRTPVWVAGDAQRLAQVLDNVLGNAAKYSPANESIEVEVRADQEARVCVEDHGPGIPPEELPHVFERFYRTGGARNAQKGGSGLGLYISYRIAAAHGGQLSAESLPNSGSRFILQLPLAAAEAAPQPAR